jgi:hypothetical protein
VAVAPAAAVGSHWYPCLFPPKSSLACSYTAKCKAWAGLRQGKIQTKGERDEMSTCSRAWAAGMAVSCLLSCQATASVFVCRC